MSNFSAMTRRDDDDVRFVLEQHAELDFYSASSMTQQSGRHVVSFRQILIPIQPVFTLTPYCYML